MMRSNKLRNSDAIQVQRTVSKLHAICVKKTALQRKCMIYLNEM